MSVRITTPDDGATVSTTEPLAVEWRRDGPPPGEWLWVALTQGDRSVWLSDSGPEPVPAPHGRDITSLNLAAGWNQGMFGPLALSIQAGTDQGPLEPPCAVNLFAARPMTPPED